MMSGKQKGDNSAAITKEEQWNLTRNKILEWFNELSKYQLRSYLLFLTFKC